MRYLRRAALAAGLQAGEVGDAATCDDKGYSCLIRWAGATAAVPELLASVDPVTGVVTAGAKIAAGHVLLPWIGEPLQI